MAQNNAPGGQRSGMPGWVIAIIVVVVAIPVVIAGIGVVAALAIYGVRKNLMSAKTAEARSSVGVMARDAAASHEMLQTDGSHKLCASASQPVPDSVAKIRGMKYQSSPADWAVDSAAHAGFSCLKFSVMDPQYYQYSYRMDGSGGEGSAFTAIAHGDLGGDGNTSEFSLSGSVQGGVVKVDPQIREVSPEE